MHIHSIQTFPGRNIYSHKPVVKMIVDLGELYDTPTKDIDGLNEKLLELFPGLNTHYCSRGYEGGFKERLSEGTYLGHVTEHLIIELQNMMGYKVNYGKTRIFEEPSLYMIIFEYSNEMCGIECGKAAVSIISRLIEKSAIAVKSILDELEKISVESELGPSTKAIFEEAKKRGIPVARMGNESLLQLGQGKYSRLIEAALSDAVSCVTVDIAGNKHYTKQILNENKIPVPEGAIAYTEETAVMMAKEIGFPVVVKPFNGNQGKGVTLNLADEGQVRKAYKQAVGHSKAVIVEKYIEGKDYRILVVGDKVSAVSERRPPFITGDGIHTIEQLVEIENNNPMRGDDHEKPLTKIRLDPVAKALLLRKGLDGTYVPEVDEVIYLRENGNLSTGGTARDCTNEIHPYNCSVAVQAAKVIGLDIAGIDMTTPDISQPIHHGNGAIIEINAAPGLRMHIHPSQGESRNVAGDILDMMFPEGSPHSVPIVSVTGTNGKTTTTRLIGHVLSLAGRKVGMTTTSGIIIDGQCVLKGDNTGAVSARMVLSNPEVEAAVLETARGGIIKRGLGYDIADIGVITNISDDHLGIDGLETLEDLAFVKSLVIEAVKPNGYAVINADDKAVEYLMQRARAPVILFSMKEDHPLVLDHMAAGGKVVFLEDGVVNVFNGKKKVRLMDPKEIPITLDGKVKCNIENALAAVSVLVGLNIPLAAIRMGLKTFQANNVFNPGRFNIFDFESFRVMLDYSHNPAGYDSVAQYLSHCGAKRLVGVIGMPGDRPDDAICKVGEICGRTFSKIYVKEDRDLRGRAPGKTAEILVDGALKAGYRGGNIEVIYSEIEALETAIMNAQPGDFIIMFYEEFERAVALVNQLKQQIQEQDAQMYTMSTTP